MSKQTSANILQLAKGSGHARGVCWWRRSDCVLSLGMVWDEDGQPSPSIEVGWGGAQGEARVKGWGQGQGV